MRSRFVLVALAVGTLVTLAWAVPLAAVAYHAARTQAVAQAGRDADALAAVARVTADQEDLRRALAAVPTGRRDHLTITLPDGSLIGPVPRGPFTAYSSVRAGRSAVTVDTADGVVYVVSAGDVVVEAHVPRADFTRQLRAAWGPPVGLGLLLVALAGVAAAWMARGAVHASRELASAARRLGDGDTRVRVAPGGPPEIATAGRAFNELAGRITALVSNERELLADLSHRLRTPLTALRLNAEALPPGAGRDRVLGAALHAEQELGSIIQEARQPLRDPGGNNCDLAEVAADRTAYWAILAADQSREWTEVGLDARAPVAVGRTDATSAIDTVLGNVFQHTPPGTAYRVTVLRQGRFVRLVVDDAGPGIDTPEKALARGASGIGSTGLGLDIARRLVESAGGSLSVESSPLGGARISLSFQPGTTSFTPTPRTVCR
jgi:signal transduction histidine kinase